MRLGRLALAAGLTGGLLMAGAGPAVGEATTVECRAIEEGTEGTLVITPSGNLLANCFEHVQSPDGGSTGGGADTIDCDHAIDNDGPGVQVITPEGSVYTNCHIHYNGGQQP